MDQRYSSLEFKQYLRESAGQEGTVYERCHRQLQ